MSTINAELEKVQRQSFSYFLHETNPVNGLVIDKNAANWPASIAATGLALGSHSELMTSSKLYSRLAALQFQSH